MAPAGAALEEYFRSVTFAQPQIPVIFNCLGDVKGDDVTIPELLVRQVQSSVFMEIPSVRWPLWAWTLWWKSAPARP